MNLSDLTVCCVSANSSQYILFQDYVMRKLADDSGFQRLVCNTLPNSLDAEKISMLPNTTLFFHDVGGLKGSDAHGHALNALLERVQTEWVLIADPDICVLCPGWDTLCKRAAHHRCVAVGASNDPTWGNAKVQNFPWVYFFFARTKCLREMHIDWRPLPEWQRHLRTRMLKWVPRWAVPWLLDNGDTGCKIPDQFKRYRYTAAAFVYRHHTEPECVVMAPDVRADEYHWQGTPIVTHLGKASLRPFNEHPIAQAWVTRLTKYLSLDPKVIDQITEGSVPTYWSSPEGST
jgi:hypothetical protein